MAHAKMNAINDEALSFVAGGDYGDSKYEHNNNVCLYKPGDVVEVYTSKFHVRTVRGTVIRASMTEIEIGLCYRLTIPVPCYLITTENGVTDWYIADRIER